MALKFNDEYSSFLANFISEGEILSYQTKVNNAVSQIKNKNGLGSDYLGWVDLPENYDKDEYERIKIAAADIKSKYDMFIVIGIGGSYLGSRAAIEFIKTPRYNMMKKDTPDIHFAGNDINTSAILELLELCEDKNICVNVISKSGKTLEPAIAFRIFREYLEKKYGEDGAKERIFVTTDKKSGALKTLADSKGYQTFVVPDDIGGRYSVLSAVGLLPIAVAGIDIDELMRGAAIARKELYLSSNDISVNSCYKYAVMRNILYNKDKSIEIMVNYDSALLMTSEWWKQLYGESEGKDGKGIFPASVSFTTDLHSLGQIIQEGKRNIFETVLNIKESCGDIQIPFNNPDLDELNYIAEQCMTMHEINAKALNGTIVAHVNGGVPNIVLDIDKRDAENFGYLVYFFELACAVSGYILGVNPFDQPGVEDYKNNMFALLGKEGDKFDNIRKCINDKL